MILTCYFGDSEGEAYGGVSERHDCSHNRKPPYLIKVWNLRENDFGDAEHDHVRIAGHMTWVLVPLLMEAIRPIDRPDHSIDELLDC